MCHWPRSRWGYLLWLDCLDLIPEDGKDLAQYGIDWWIVCWVFLCFFISGSEEENKGWVYEILAFFWWVSPLRGQLHLCIEDLWGSDSLKPYDEPNILKGTQAAKSASYFLMI